MPREANPKALLQVDDIYRSLVKVTSNSVYIADKKCQYLYVNPIHCARIGLQPDELIGRNYAEHLHATPAGKSPIGIFIV